MYHLMSQYLRNSSILGPQIRVHLALWGPRVSCCRKKVSLYCSKLPAKNLIPQPRRTSTLNSHSAAALSPNPTPRTCDTMFAQVLPFTVTACKLHGLTCIATCTSTRPIKTVDRPWECMSLGRILKLVSLFSS